MKIVQNVLSLTQKKRAIAKYLLWGYTTTS